MSTSLEQIGVSIATKDRWEDLEITLEGLQNYGLSHLETVVMDDGSAQPIPRRLQEKFPWVQFHRREKSVGIEGRNRIAELLHAPLVLQLDDDSFPVAGDLAAAADWLQARPNVAALAFQIIFKNESAPADFAARAPFPVRDFIGCGALFKRELFLSLGGYEGRLRILCEEPEFCVRAIGQGHAIYGYPAFVVQHNVTPRARNHAWRTRIFIRNEMLMALWNFPFPENILRPARAFPGLLIKNPEMRGNWRALLHGYLEAPFRYLTWRRKNKRLTHAQFRAWKRLPMAVEGLMGLKKPGR